MVLILSGLIERGFKSRFVDPAALLTQAELQRDAAVRREEAAREYGLIAQLAGSKVTLASARSAWQAFRAEYQ